jgi:hypothetical protein
MTPLKECVFCEVQNSVHLHGFDVFEPNLNLAQCQFWICVFQTFSMKRPLVSGKRTTIDQISMGPPGCWTSIRDHFSRASLSFSTFSPLAPNVHQMYNSSMQGLFWFEDFVHLIFSDRKAWKALGTQLTGPVLKRFGGSDKPHLGKAGIPFTDYFSCS